MIRWGRWGVREETVNDALKEITFLVEQLQVFRGITLESEGVGDVKLGSSK